MSSAWLYFNGTRAGLTRPEVRNLPLGRVFDHIACWQIAECGAKEKKGKMRSGGSLYEQMKRCERK